MPGGVEQEAFPDLGSFFDRLRHHFV